MIRQLWTGLAFVTLMAGAAWPAARIEIGQPWSPATPPAAKVGAGYGTITNHGAAADRLLGGSSPIATRVEIHELRQNGDTAEMRLIENGIEIAPGGTLELQPGAYHLMLIGLSAPLTAGDRIPVTLEFEKAGPIEAEFAIRPAGKQGAGGHHDAAGAHQH
ncbi:copper chaperone PCu(A)C [Paracoccus aminophilus]|uniref:Copper chaperone PCu(A)C n=1 Tax=Paracoccus aminophilus JCM 7686 TaxID=1367847 RepID=S5XTB8_PARAH|nr:copper chaperone PCu(A)C [Paracoccus aminophilus]AGT08412.1 hypothetical protein JCM7686_1311 [Paracoccus aminophilus JCM 7686]